MNGEGDKGDAEGDDLSSESEEEEGGCSGEGNDDDREAIKTAALMISGMGTPSSGRLSISGGGGNSGGMGTRTGSSWRRGRTVSTAAAREMSSFSFGLGATSPLLPSRPSPDSYQHCFKLEDSSSPSTAVFHSSAGSRRHQRSASNPLEETLIQSLTITKPRNNVRGAKLGSASSWRGRRSNTASVGAQASDSRLKAELSGDLVLPEGNAGK